MTDHDKPMSMVEREVRVRFTRVALMAAAAGGWLCILVVHPSLLFAAAFVCMLFLTGIGILAEAAALTESK